MAPEIERGAVLLLASGSLVAASGVFVLLRAAGVRDVLAGLVLASGGAGMFAVTLARYVAETRTGDVMSFFLITAAAAAGLLCVAFRRPGPEGGE
jgi:hypothetical protein